MSPDQSNGVTIERYGHEDLAAAALRKSFARPPLSKMYLRPAHSFFLAILTAGLWPTGLLLSRIWMYASFQRFRAGELGRWLDSREGQNAQSQESTAQTLRLARSIRPTSALLAGWLLWSIALICGVIVIYLCVTSIVRGRPLPTPRSEPVMAIWMMATMFAGFAQLFGVSSIALGMRQMIERLPKAHGDFCPRHVNPNLPLWVLWPLAHLMLIVPLIVLRLHVPLIPIVLMLAVIGTLAAEVQRGYITVADRRLCSAVARAIGRIMYGGGNSR